jgi:hypothetical protein
MAKKDSVRKDPPPTRTPSMSGNDINCAAFSADTLPP